MNKQILIHAKRELYKAADEIGSAKLRLEDTPFEKDMERLWDTLIKVYEKINNELRK